MSMSNTGMTLGSIFGAITTTANTFSNSLDAVNNGVGMLNKMVTDAAQRQSIDSKLDMANYKKLAIQTKSQDLATSRLQAKTWMAQSPDHASMYEQAFSELNSLFEEAKQ